ncbi:GrpB family protein [Actinomadura coerulea]|uniref:GrpB family protein n=1 Tax=Actinomadura coerulea TaxID=46159 RepID=UPI0034365FF6
MILDIAVALTLQATSEDVITALEALGYLYRGDKGDHGGLLFVLEDRPAHRIAHVHLVEPYTPPDGIAGSPSATCCAPPPNIRAEYHRVKRELADQHSKRSPGLHRRQDVLRHQVNPSVKNNLVVPGRGFPVEPVSMSVGDT